MRSRRSSQVKSKAVLTTSGSLWTNNSYVTEHDLVEGRIDRASLDGMTQMGVGNTSAGSRLRRFPLEEAETARIQLDDDKLDQGAAPISVLVWVPVNDPFYSMSSDGSSQIAWGPLEPRYQLVFGEHDQLIRLPSCCVDGSGLKTRGVKKGLVLYRRAPLRKQWEQINRYSIEASARLWVVGPTGTGKSCTALAFTYALDPLKWDVIWIYYCPRNEVFSCMCLVGNKKAKCIVNQIDAKTQIQEILSSTSTTPTTVVFLDGFSKQTTYPRSFFFCSLWQAINATNHRLVIVSSTGVPDDIYRAELCEPLHCTSSSSDEEEEDEGDSELTDEMIFSLDSWRLEEYEEAVSLGEFWSSVEANLYNCRKCRNHPNTDERTISKLLEEKYFVAGGNARLMFDVATEQGMKFLDRAMATVEDGERFLFNFGGVAASISPPLGQYHNDDGWSDVHLISRYVVRELAQRMRPELFQEYGRVCEVNPSINYYNLEGWFFSRLCHSNTPIQYDRGSNIASRDWETANTIYFDPHRIQAQLEKPTWMAPWKWSQGGYDAVYVGKVKGLVRFVQLPRGDKHLYDAEAFVTVLSTLTPSALDDVTKVELCFLVPNVSMKDFQLPVQAQEFVINVVGVASRADGKNLSKWNSHSRTCVVERRQKCSCTARSALFPCSSMWRLFH